MALGILAAFLLLPLVEIAGFILVGGWLGLGGTLLAVIAGVAIGLFIVRRQGLGFAAQMRASLARGEQPIGAVLDGFLVLLSGLLFIIPGFFTDLLGLLLLIPPVRRGVGALLVSRMVMNVTARSGSSGPGSSGPGSSGPDSLGRGRPSGTPVIEGDFHEIDPDEPRRVGPEPPSSGRRELP